MNRLLVWEARMQKKEEEIQIRRLTPDGPFDLDGINRLILSLGPDREPMSEDGLRGLLRQQPMHVFLVAETSEGQCVGTRYMVVAETPGGGLFAYGGWLAVDPAYRRRGIAERLLRTGVALTKDICEARRQRVFLLGTSNATRAPMHALMEKMFHDIGYEHVGEPCGERGVHTYRLVLRPPPQD